MTSHETARTGSLSSRYPQSEDDAVDESDHGRG